MANGRLGPATAGQRIEMLAAQERRLALEVEHVALRQRVRLKIDDWPAIDAAEHQIGGEIEVFGADKINEAYQRVLASDARHRFVIDSATLAQAPPADLRR